MALKILQGVQRGRARSNHLLQETYRRHTLSGWEKSLLQELVAGVLRWRGRLDWALGRMTGGRFQRTHPLLANILRLGAYQILFLETIGAHTAVDESVRLAHNFAHRGAASLVNAVLRRLSEQKDELIFPDPSQGAGAISISWSHPEWLVRRWLRRWGLEKTLAICRADNRAPLIGLRVNSLKAGVTECRRLLLQDGVCTRPGALIGAVLEVEAGKDLSRTRAYEQGWVEIQSAVSALVGEILQPRPGERVLDVCAGRGVKSTHLAQLMKNEGRILAMDIDGKKLAQLEDNCRRMGVRIVRAKKLDATIELSRELGEKSFERILLDAPCSGLGVLGRYPEARWRKQPAMLERMHDLQHRLLESAAACLAPGGVLLYAVCSLEPEENEQVIERFLAAHPSWRLLPIEGPAGGGSRFYWRSWEIAGEIPADGFFLAKLGTKG